MTINTPRLMRVRIILGRFADSPARTPPWMPQQVQALWNLGRISRFFLEASYSTQSVLWSTAATTVTLARNAIGSDGATIPVLEGGNANADMNALLVGSNTLASAYDRIILLMDTPQPPSTFAYAWIQNFTLSTGIRKIRYVVIDQIYTIPRWFSVGAPTYTLSLDDPYTGWSFLEHALVHELIHTYGSPDSTTGPNTGFTTGYYPHPHTAVGPIGSVIGETATGAPTLTGFGASTSSVGVVGSSSLGLHPSMGEKLRLGWVSPTGINPRIQRITRSGTYRLRPVELTSYIPGRFQGAILAREYTTGYFTDDYTLEFRQPIGFDAGITGNFLDNTNGLLITALTGTLYAIGYPPLQPGKLVPPERNAVTTLDASPVVGGTEFFPINLSPEFLDRQRLTLNVGQTLDLPLRYSGTRRVRIAPLSVSAAECVYQVTYL